MIELIRSAVTALRDRKGVTAMEYAVIAAGIVILVAVGAQTLGTSLESFFNGFASYLNGKPQGLPN